MAATLILRILIVDDNVICAKLLARIIKSKQYEEPITIETTIYNSPNEALNDLKNTPYDIIFTDIEMTPTISGVGIARSIRNDDNYMENRYIPIYAVTCKADEKSRISYENAGITGCLEKPAKPDSVHIIIEERVRQLMTSM